MSRSPPISPTPGPCFSNPTAPLRTTLKYSPLVVCPACPPRPRGNYYDSCVAGIGLNVNQTEFPDDISATSIKLVTNQELDLNLMLNSLMKSIAGFYLKLNDDRKSLQESYQLSMLGMGEERKFEAGGDKFIGIIQGTDEFGRLLIKKGNEVLAFQHKEVQMLF